jgi:hypothetical protein
VLFLPCAEEASPMAVLFEAFEIAFWPYAVLLVPVALEPAPQVS